MSKIAYTWSSATPPRPGVYTTRKGESKYLTLRQWDGARWWQIEWGASARKSMQFKWPKGSRTRFPSGMAAYRDTLGLRRINDQAGIQWGDPYKVFDRAEVLAYLVRRGYLPTDWETCWQDEMRQAEKNATA